MTMMPRIITPAAPEQHGPDLELDQRKKKPAELKAIIDKVISSRP
jgi:hypothetical protein